LDEKTGNKGAAVGFHYVMSRIPVTDEFSRRITAHERTVTETEMHHGSEVIPELARTFTSQKALEEVKRRVTDIHVQELLQLNEQCLHPLSAQKMRRLEEDLCQNRIEPIPLHQIAVS